MTLRSTLSRRRTVLGATSVAAVTMLAACARSDGAQAVQGAPGDADRAPRAPRTPLPAASEPATAGRSLGTPVPLEMWLPGRQADATALEPFHRQFEEEVAGAATVSIQLVTNEDMMDRLTAALAAGTPPDVARLKEYRLADLGARRALLPLDAHVAGDSSVRLADFTPQSVEGSRYDAQYTGTEGELAAGRPRSLLGLPDSHQLVVLYWNRDLVARAGLDPNASPADWDALRRGARAVQALTAPAIDDAAGDKAGSPASAAPAPRGFQFYEFSLREQTYCWFMEWVWRAGGEVWASPPLRATLDTPHAARALQFQVDLLHADRTAVPAGTAVPDLIANVAQGLVGYWMTTANAALTYARTAPGLRFGIGPLPPDRRDAHQLQHNALSVFASSRRPDVAYRLVSFRSRADVQARWAADGAWLPVRPALWNRPPFNETPEWRAIGALVHRPGNRTKPAVPEWDAFTAAILPPLLAAWRGEAAPKDALAHAQTAANTHLARAGN